jgi:hypothetical protein
VLDAARIAETDEAAYSVAGSLVEFLLTRGDRAALIRFAVEGQKAGWDAAARTVYGLNSVAGLEAAWRDWTLRGAQH